MPDLELHSNAGSDPEENYAAMRDILRAASDAEKAKLLHRYGAELRILARQVIVRRCAKSPRVD